jgi:hypothetical protein
MKRGGALTGLPPRTVAILYSFTYTVVIVYVSTFCGADGADGVDGDTCSFVFFSV